MNKRIGLFTAVVIAAVIALSLTVSASADLLYGIDVGEETIFTLDTETGELIKYFGHPFVGCPQVHGGLDWDSQGNLYLEQYGLLFLIDLEHPENDVEIGSCNELDFECFEIVGDTGYAEGGSDGYLYTIDLSTNVATPLPIATCAPCPPCSCRSSGMASNDGTPLRMYGARTSLYDIIEIDPLTGENLGVVVSGLQDYATSLAYGSSGNLWYITALADTLYSCDPITGTVDMVLTGLSLNHVTGLTGEFSDGLRIAPTAGLVASGDAGGPFTPDSKVYTLENLGDTAINYTVTTDQTWVSLSSTSGSLMADETVDVTVSINAGANALPIGVHDGTVNFFNTTNGIGDTSRPVSVAVGVPSAAYTFNMDTDPGWATQGLWAWGQPTGGGGAYGNPDPTSGYTGPNVYGYNLDGDYENSLPERHLTTTTLDCSSLVNVTLKFYRWLNVEAPSYDHATISVSNDGSTWAIWTPVWFNTSRITDAAWSLQEYDISAVADGQSTVYLRWTMGTTDNSWQFSGWNIDDVEIWGIDVSSQPVDTVGAGLDCQPGSGMLPLTVGMTAQLENLTGENRRAAAHIDLLIAGGSSYTNWRAGWTNLLPLELFSRSWNQNLPALGTLVGDNVFTLVAEDVTPAPYNQPPYLPAGDSATDTCTVTGVAP
jgi:hypothetical protein